MTPEDLIAECFRHESENKDIQLVVPRRATGKNIRLFGNFGPLSKEIACVNADGNTVAWFDPKKVRKCVEDALYEAFLEQEDV